MSEKLKCPECFASLKAASEYTPGKVVTCRKCETPFRVPDPDAPADTTRKRVRADAGENERASTSSPLRFAILGVLLLVMGGLGFMLYQKKQREAEAERAEAARADAEKAAAARAGGGEKGPGQKGAGTGARGGAKLNLAPLVGGMSGARPTPKEARRLLATFAAALVGQWEADVAGKPEVLTYGADGSYTVTPADGEPVRGKYAIKEAVGTRTFKVQLDGPDGSHTITATLENGELTHPTLQPGLNGTFRKRAAAVPDPTPVAPAPRAAGPREMVPVAPAPRPLTSPEGTDPQA